MVTKKHLTIEDEQEEFIQEKGFSPSKLLQQKINELMEEMGVEK